MFHPDSPLSNALTRIFNFVAANLLFVLTSLPIFTIGASWSALYHVISNQVDDGSSSLGLYFEAFREKFKIATKLWLPSALLLGLLATEILFVSNTHGTAIALPGGNVLQVIFVVVAVGLMALLSYVFPLIGMNAFSIRQALGISFYLAVSNWPSTIVMTILNMGSVLTLFLLPDLVAVLLPVWGLLVFSAVAWIDALLIKKALKKNTSEDQPQ